MNHTNLFIVGIQRSGTTSLARILDDHPEIYLARPIGGPKPEPKFFFYEENIKKGRDFYEQLYFWGRPERILGEKSVVYADAPFIPERIHSFYPDAKIFFILRNPIQRAISNYFLSVRSKREGRDIEVALFSENRDRPKDVAMAPHDYLVRGNYVDYIERYEKWFDDITVLISESCLNSVPAIQEAYSRLGLRDHSPSASVFFKKFNEAPRNEVPNRVLRRLEEHYGEEITRTEKKLGTSLDIWRKRL
jgi:hypothetical protein